MRIYFINEYIISEMIWKLRKKCFDSFFINVQKSFVYENYKKYYHKPKIHISILTSQTQKKIFKL